MEEAQAPPAARTVADELKTLKRRILAADVTLGFEPQAALDSCGHPPALCALPLRLLQMEVAARMTLEQMIDALQPEQPPVDWSAGLVLDSAPPRSRSASAPPSVAGRPPNAPLLPKRFDENVAQTQPITARERTSTARRFCTAHRGAARRRRRREGGGLRRRRYVCALVHDVVDDAALAQLLAERVVLAESARARLSSTTILMILGNDDLA